MSRKAGYKHSEETKKKLRQKRTPMSPTARKHLSELRKGKAAPWKAGENNPNWKGGVSKQKDYINRIHREAHARRKLTVLMFYGGNPPKCACCGEGTIQFLAIDHVNGGGNQHRKQSGIKGGGIYMWLIRNGFPEGYQVLCHNCNCAKGFFGKCPHEQAK